MNKGAKMEIELKPCPWCNREVSFCKCDNKDCSIIICDSCDYSFEYIRDNKTSTARVWNTRPAEKMELDREKIADIISKVDYPTVEWKRQVNKLQYLSYAEAICRTFTRPQVKLPDKKRTKLSDNYIVQANFDGWNAALDKVREMNGGNHE